MRAPLTRKGALVAETIDAPPDAVNVIVRSPANPVMIRSVKVATPPAATAVTVPDNTPPPVEMAAVMVAVDEVARFPAASRNSTTGCTPNRWRINALEGCERSASVANAPGVTVTTTALETTLPAAAVIVAEPVFTAVTNPALTVATVGSLLDHTTEAATVCPPLFCTTAASVSIWPDGREACADGVTVTEAGVTSGGTTGVSPPHASAATTADNHLRRSDLNKKRFTGSAKGRRCRRTFVPPLMALPPPTCQAKAQPDPRLHLPSFTIATPRWSAAQLRRTPWASVFAVIASHYCGW